MDERVDLHMSDMDLVPLLVQVDDTLASNALYYAVEVAVREMHMLFLLSVRIRGGMPNVDGFVAR